MSQEDNKKKDWSLRDFYNAIRTEEDAIRYLTKGLYPGGVYSSYTYSKNVSPSNFKRGNGKFSKGYYLYILIQN